MNGTVETMKNIFLEIDLKSLNRDSLQQGMRMIKPNTDKERELI